MPKDGRLEFRFICCLHEASSEWPGFCKRLSIFENLLKMPSFKMFRIFNFDFSFHKLPTHCEFNSVHYRLVWKVRYRVASEVRFLTFEEISGRIFPHVFFVVSLSEHLKHHQSYRCYIIKLLRIWICFNVRSSKVMWVTHISNSWWVSRRGRSEIWLNFVDFQQIPYQTIY